MAPFETRRPALDRIDTRRTPYRITTPRDLTPLRRSIEAVGLMCPPLLLGEETAGPPCTVVFGHRRIAACRELGWTRIPARMARPAEMGTLDRVRLAVTDNALQRPLDPLETSRALALLAACVEDPEALAAEAGRLNLPAARAVIDKMTPLCRLPEPVREALVGGVISLSMAEELQGFPEPEASELVRIFTALGMGLNRQREFIGLVKEIAPRASVDVMAVLASPAVAEVLGDADMDRNRKSREIRRRLRRWRYPAITRAEERYAELSAALGLGTGARLLPPRDFEGTVYTLQLPFETPDQLENHLKKIENLPKSPVLEAILQRDDR